MIKDENLYKKYFDTSDDLLSLIESMWNSSSARSYIKGAKAEVEFKNIMRTSGWSVDKVEDQDKTKRYDFEISNFIKTHRIETKILMPNLSVDIGYRDFREVVLPSGKTWKTKARCITEKFDYLAFCLVNHEGYTIKDFVCMHFSEIPKFSNLNKLKKFSNEDQVWILENYLQQNVKLISPHDSRCIKLHDLLDA